MRLHFVWMGKTKDRRCAALIEEYLGRIRRFASVEISELREPGNGESAQVVAKESARLSAAVEQDDFIVLLDETGQEMTSAELAGFLERKRLGGIRRLAFVIGGFAGVDETMKRRADLSLSLSRLTLTHELARVILTEQIYRAFTLLAGFPYHKH